MSLGPGGAAQRLAEILEAEIGLRALPERLEWIVAAAERSGSTTDGLLDALADQRTRDAALKRLIDEVTVKESFFFRQATQLEAVDWPALLRCAQADGRDAIRVWSAACATGDEVYTLAMLAAEGLGHDEPPVSVLGTDVSAAALAQARHGRYGARAVRGVPEAARERHLASHDGGFEVGPALRRLVRFARHNLAAGPALPDGEGPFDLVVCRNVLIYFDDRALDHAAATLGEALAPGGALVVGVTDRLCLSLRAARDGAVRPVADARAAPPRPRRRRPSRPAGPALAHAAGRPRPAPEHAAPPAPPAPPAPNDAIQDALRLADARDLPAALDAARRAVTLEPMDAAARFVTGMLELAAGDARAAVDSLRAALYADPTLAIAAFQLGRAYDALGDEPAALRAHRQALATLDPDDAGPEWLLGGVDVADVASACRHRLRRTVSPEAPAAR